MLYDSSYIDTSTEGLNMYSDFVALGLPLTKATSYTPDDIYNGLLTNYDFFVVPELEKGNFDAHLTSSDRQSLKAWVQNGGKLIIAGTNTQYDTQLLNSVIYPSKRSTQLLSENSDLGDEIRFLKKLLMHPKSFLDKLFRERFYLKLYESQEFRENCSFLPLILVTEKNI